MNASSDDGSIPEDSVSGMDDALRELWQGRSAKMHGVLGGGCGKAEDFPDPLLGIQESAPIPPGTKIGKFTLLRALGIGGMGSVYEAEQVSPNRRVAVKLIHPLRFNPIAARRFALEAEILGRLRHPGIAEIYESGQFESPFGTRPFLAMELVRGEPIHRYVKEQGIAPSQCIELVAKICDALQYAHFRGVIHRDLKPDNILVDEFGAPRLLDFGIAKLTEAGAPAGDALTGTQEWIGTMEYMSPEQCQGRVDDLDSRSDIFSLGIILYQLLAGKHPFDLQGKTAIEKARALCEVEPVDLERASSLGDEIRWVVRKALEKDRQQRYQSAADLALDLRRCLRGERPTAEPTSFWGQARRFVRKNRVAVSAAAGVLLSLIVGLAVSTNLYLLSERRLEEWTRLADRSDLSDLLHEMKFLSSRPEDVPRLEGWIRKMEALVARLPAHRKTIESLRERALPFDGEQREQNRRSHPLFPEYDDMLRYRAGLAARVSAEGEVKSSVREELNRLQTKIEHFDSEMNRRRLWVFPDPRDAWHHDQLLLLVNELEKVVASEPLGNTMARVRCQLDFAQAAREESVNKFSKEWSAAIEAIADEAANPQYRGLRIQAQTGLVPLGPDPDSHLWEFAHLESGSIPRRVAGGRIEFLPESSIVLVLLPGGSVFMTGSSDRERPSNVSLAPFFMSKYEMTQSQWVRLGGTNPSTHSPAAIPIAGERAPSSINPVETVSWFEASEAMTRWSLLLPTEAQWEYAARGGVQFDWWTGMDSVSLQGAENLRDAAWGRSRAHLKEAFAGFLDDGFERHAPVGSFLANPFGLYDVLGNVSEWVRDGMGPYEIPAQDGDGLRIRGGGGAGYWVQRGGSFRESPENSRCNYRGGMRPEWKSDSLGLRPARGLDR